MKNIDRIKRNIATQREEDYLRTVERTLWVGIVLIALFAGFILGGVCVRVMETKAETVNDYYYTFADYYSPDSVVTTNGNIFCVSDMEIDPLTRYRLKLNDNGTETVVDDEVLEIIPMD